MLEYLLRQKGDKILDYLTTKELAELKGCSERHATRLVKDGKIKGEIKFDFVIKQERYFIAVRTLPEDLQAKY